MHLLYLAVLPDVLLSMLLDLSDGTPHRDLELETLWGNYRSWCESQGSSADLSKPCVINFAIRLVSKLYTLYIEKNCSSSGAL